MNRPELVRRTASEGGRAPTRPGRQVFTVRLDGALFGLPIECVRAVLRAEAVAPAPLGPSWVIGLVNLRGHVVVAASLRARFGLAEPARLGEPLLTVSVEIEGETLAVAVDAVGDVVDVDESQLIATPPGMSDAVRRLTSGVYAMPAGFLPVIDLHAAFQQKARAAVEQPLSA
ncbi:MAG TPA: chemotaxis protein CheW [Beijerinckiaceae bacterium]|jgi:purine-binding chemotaxis protein CheW